MLEYFLKIFDDPSPCYGHSFNPKSMALKCNYESHDVAEFLEVALSILKLYREILAREL